MNEPDGGSQPIENQMAPSSPDTPGQSVAVLATSWTGPLPPPDILQQYDAVVPGAANRILMMAENLRQHRIDMMKAASDREDKALSLVDKTLSGDASRSKLGLWLGFVVVLVCIGTAAWLASTGKTVFGLVFFLTPLAGLAGVFVYGTQARKAERRRNSANQPEERTL